MSDVALASSRTPDPTPDSTPEQSAAEAREVVFALRSLRARAQHRTIDWDEVAYRANISSRTLRRWARSETAPTPTLVRQLAPILRSMAA